MKDKNEFAKESVVEDYLADLLTEPTPKANLEKDIAQRLLDRADIALASDAAIISSVAVQQNALDKTKNREQIEFERHKVQQDDKEILLKVETETSSMAVSASSNLQEALDERFQALFFEVAGLTLAVPLIDLGGIHEITKISPIIGKPLWFMGVMLKNQDKFNVVDAARWVMPEKYTTEMAENVDYRFLINLGKTPWGFTCEKLISTVELNKSDVQWRKASGKRPWLAGMVKEQMCALINVAELVEMLKAGANNKQ